MARSDVELDPIIARRLARQRRSQTRLLVILAGFGIGGVMAVVLAAGFMLMKGKSTPSLGVSTVLGVSESREGESWTHAELEKHLESKGMKLERTETFSGFGLNSVKYTVGSGTVEIDVMPTVREAKLRADLRHGWQWGLFVISGHAKDVERIKQILQ